MTQFMRKAQSGMSNDLSSSIQDTNLKLTSLGRVGISSRITKIAYDPVQSLLAIGTASTKFGPGQIYVFGKGRIQATFPLPRRGVGVKELVFCADRLVALDDRGDLVVVDLKEKTLQAGWSPPGQVTAFASDAALDYVMLGMSNGEIMAYDLDRENLAHLRLPNFWQEKNPRARTLPIVALQFHPRDIGTLLIGYSEGAVIYSLKQNKVMKFFHYQVPRGAPGGDANPANMNIDRNPRLTNATWHPTGGFVLTGHEDSSLVIWDPRDGRIIMARSLTETNIEKPGSGARYATGSFDPKLPILQFAWCANQDPEDTGILIAGGGSTSMPAEGLTFMELGRTPNYMTASWQNLADHFANPRRIRVMPTPPNVPVVNFCVIPRKSPWFAGAHDPIAIIALLSSGEITTLSFPSGYPITPTNQLHVSLTFIHPFISCISHSPVDRTRWLGMVENRSIGPPILRGGIEPTASLQRSEARNIIQTAHADGTIRVWDAGHGDEIENPSVLQADVGRALGRLDDVQITKLSLSAASGELAAGLKTGEVVVFRWGRNKNPGQEPPPGGPAQPKALTNVSERKDSSLSEGFQPFTLLNQDDGPCTALKVSDIGFIAAGFEGGSIVVIDMRGPAIIHNDVLRHVSTAQKGGLFRQKQLSAGPSGRPVVLEFSVMTLDGDDYSSILLHVATDIGLVNTFKILPTEGGRYTVAFAGVTPLDDRVILLHPLVAASGTPAFATPTAVAGLRNGIKVDGVLVAVTKTEARIFRPSQRGSNKSWDGKYCHSAALTRRADLQYALVGLFGDGTARAFTIPGLKEISSVRVSDALDMQRLSDAVITSTGDVIGWTGPSEVTILNIYGRAGPSNSGLERLINPTLLVPPRPTISSFEWVSGTQYMTASDLDVLIGGPDRPPSKRMLDQTRNDEAVRRTDALRARSGTAAGTAEGDQEGYWAYMTRQVNERAERLGMMGESMDHLESNSAGWADDVSKFVSQQKKNLVMGALRRGAGF